MCMIFYNLCIMEISWTKNASFRYSLTAKNTNAFFEMLIFVSHINYKEEKNCPNATITLLLS